MSLRKKVGAATLVAAAASVVLVAQPPQGPTFKSGTQVVSLFVMVADAQKRLVPDLMQEEFQVFDNDKPQPIVYFDNSIRPINVVVMLDTSGSMTLTLDLMQEEFQVFDNDKPQPIVYFDNSIRPINVVVMLDTSGSMTLTIDLLKQAAEQFILRLLPEDKARVGAFNDKIQINARWSSNRDQLITDVKDLDYGNGTRLWDAVGASLDELKGIDGRRVILVFTDGDDTESKKMSLGC